VVEIDISYVGDLSPSHSTDVNLIENDLDYVRACEDIVKGHLSDVPKIQYWVRSRSHFAWLKDYTDQLGLGAHFKEMTPRLHLAEKWSVILPDWLSDDMVLGQSLLEIQFDLVKAPQDFSSAFLGQIIDSAFVSEAFNAKDTMDIIKSLVSKEGSGAIDRYPLCATCLEDKCSQWIDRSSESWEKELINYLLFTPKDLWHWLSLGSYLSGYPKETLEYLLSPKQVQFVRKVPSGVLGNIQHEPEAKEQVITHITHFFVSIENQIKSIDDFQKVLAMTSGELLLEFQKIIEILKSNKFHITVDDIGMVEAKFSSCPGVSKGSLNLLKHLVVPERPSLIGSDDVWSADDWIRWTSLEYAPYRNWQTQNSEYDAELESTVARFSDWMIQEYPSVHKDPELSLIHSLRFLGDDTHKNELSIVLMIDCLPIIYWDILDEAMRNIGLNRHSLDYRFAALPTITATNKPSIVSGLWEEKRSNYATLLQARSQSDWRGKKTVYLSTLKDMSEQSLSQKPAVLLLNFIDGDELLHQDLESKNMTYEEELSRQYARIAESVSRLVEMWTGPREQVGIHVITDHGACRILEEESQSFDSKVVNKLFPDDKYRFVKVDEADIDSVSKNMWDLGHKFTPPFESEKQIYFLPKGHNTVRKSGRAKGYLHGGLTPEEVIVPVSSYKLVKTAFKRPATRFVGLDVAQDTGLVKFYIQRIIELKIEINNLNSASLKVSRSSIIAPAADIKEFETKEIPAGDKATILMSCYFKKEALEENNLAVELVYLIEDTEHTLTLELDCEFKSAQSSGFNLRDL
jgi:hypothetical protein